MTLPSRRFSRTTPDLISSRREARNAALEVRDEARRLRAAHRELLAKLRQRRRELIADHKAESAKRVADLRQAIADLRASAKEQAAARKAQFRERLREVDAEIRAARAELRDLTPAARAELREIMARGETLKSARAKVAGSKGARARIEKRDETLDAILDELGVSRFSDSAKEVRDFIRKWLTKRPAKNATSLQRMAGYDPRRNATAIEQWREWASENAEELQALELEWTEAALQRELQREQDTLEAAHKYLEQVAHEAEQTLQTAAKCADPWTYQDLEQFRAEIPETNLRDEGAISDIAGKVRDAIRVIESECVPRKRKIGSKRARPRDRKVKRVASARRRQPRRAPLTAKRVLTVIKTLADRITGQTRLAALRAHLPGDWEQVSDAVRRLSKDGKIHLYREDNNAALTQADREAAVFVGGEPRHIAVPAKARTIGRDDFDQRRADRVNRLETRASKKAAEAAAHRQRADAIGQRFEMGQPIILGHHSTKRALKDREKMDNATRAAVREQEAAQALARRALAADRNTAVSSDDPRAVEKLQARIDAEEAQLQLVDTIRKIIKRTITPETRAAELARLGLPSNHELIRYAMADPITGAFPVKLNSFVATNMRANLRRLRDRTAQLSSLATVPQMEPEQIGTAVLSESNNRVKLEFDSKPAPDLLKLLKSYGFRWSPRESAWQAKITPANRLTLIAKGRTIAAQTQTQPSAPTRKVQSKSVRAAGSKLRRGARKEPKRTPLRGYGGETGVFIEWGTVTNNNAQQGGWLPQVWIDGRPKNSPWSNRGRTREEALSLAELQAREESERYLGDYSVTVSQRPELKASAPRQLPRAPRLPSRRRRVTPKSSAGG